MRLLLLLLLAATSWPSLAKRNDYPFVVVTENMGTHHRVLARNNGPAPVAAKISIALSDGAASDRKWPATVTVPAGQTLPVGNVYASVVGRGFRYNLSTTWLLGDIRASHTPGVAYRLPFADGHLFTISQAAGGPITTHTLPENAYAVDIAMPEGTLVVAARAGKVIKVESNYTQSGKVPELLDKANEVVILHEDGTMGRYAHLGPGRQLVQPGQQVKDGDAIGYSGSTGFSSGPHLHLAVTRLVESPDGNLGEESLPIIFYAHNPPVRFTPRAEMQVLAEYAAPIETLQAQLAARSARSAQSVGTAVEQGGDMRAALAEHLAPLLNLKHEIDEWTGSPALGWIAVGTPAVLLLFFGLSGGRTASIDRQEPTGGWTDRS